MFYAGSCSRCGMELLSLEAISPSEVCELCKHFLLDPEEVMA